MLSPVMVLPSTLNLFTVCAQVDNGLGHDTNSKPTWIPPIRWLHTACTAYATHRRWSWTIVTNYGQYIAKIFSTQQKIAFFFVFILRSYCLRRTCFKDLKRKSTWAKWERTVLDEIKNVRCTRERENEEKDGEHFNWTTIQIVIAYDQWPNEFHTKSLCWHAKLTLITLRDRRWGFAL